MSGLELENFRHAILKVAQANESRFGLGVDAFKLHVAAYGFTSVSAADVRREAEYLADKKLLREVNKTLSPENRVWQLTAEGRDYIAMRES